MMGWWQISDAENPDIMLPNKDPNPLLCGDGPADIVGAWLDEALGDVLPDLIKEYEEGIGRKPYTDEVLAAITFCIGNSAEQHGLKWKEPDNADADGNS